MREIETTLILDGWVVDRLSRFVRLGNFVDYEDHIPNFREVPSITREFDSRDLETNLIDPSQEADSTPKRILSILFNGRVRKGNLEIADKYRGQFHERIRRRTVRAEPVNIILPTLPFKDQNPLTTRLPLDAIDLGEYLLMAQLREIIRSVEKIYPPGLHFTLLTDGQVYAKMFANGELDKIKAYRESCKVVRDELGLADDVRILDMGVVVMNEPKFFSIQRDIRTVLSRLQREDPRVTERMRSLRWGMLVNVPSLGYHYNDFKRFLTLPEKELPKDLLDRIREASLDYASFALTMSFLNCLERQFPGDLRGTVHPKDWAELPIHLVDRKSVVFPYNGVPVVSEQRLSSTGSLRRSARIVRYCDVLQYPEAQAVFLHGGDHPFYYLISEHKKLE